MSIISSTILIYKITSVHFDLVLNVINLKLAQGFFDGDNFIKLEEQDVPISQKEVAIMVTSELDPEKNVYLNVKDKLYQYLLDKNIVSGTIG